MMRRIHTIRQWWTVLPLVMVVAGTLLCTAPAMAEDNDQVLEFLQLGEEFAKRVKDYRGELEGAVNLKYDDKQKSVKEKYRKKIETLTNKEHTTLLAAINRLELFVEKYPSHPRYSPEALFRLSELYFLRAFTIAANLTDGMSPREQENEFDRIDRMKSSYYRRSRVLAERVVNGFPRYNKRDLAYYAVARACGKLDDVICTQRSLVGLVSDYPESTKAPTAYYRLGLLFYVEPDLVEVPAVEQRMAVVEGLLLDDARMLGEADGKTPEEKQQLVAKETSLAQREIENLRQQMYVSKRRFCNVSSRHYLIKAYSLPLEQWEHPSKFADVLFLLAAAEFTMMKHEWMAAAYFERFMSFYEDQNDNSDNWTLAKGRLDQAQHFYSYIYTTIYLSVDPTMGGEIPDGSAAKKLRERLEGLGKKEWMRQVYSYFIDYSQQNRNPVDAIEGWRALIALDPTHPDNPELNYKLMTYYNETLYDENNPASLLFLDREREFMARSYGEGSPWHEANRDNPAALAKAHSYLKEVISIYGDDHFARGDQLMQDGYEDEAKEEYLKAATVYESFLKQFPNDTDAYDRRMDLADALYSAGKFTEALAHYEKVRDSKLGLHYRGQAALRSIICFDRIIAATGLPQKEVAALDLTPEEMAARKPMDPKDPSLGFVVAKRDLPEERVKYLETVDKYLQWYNKGYKKSMKAAKANKADSKGDAAKLWGDVINMIKENRKPKNRLTIRYTIGTIRLFYHDFEAAKEIFTDIIKEYPGSEQALNAHRQIVFMLTREARLKDILFWCDGTADYIAKHKGVNKQLEKEILAEVTDVKARASYDLALALEAGGFYENAGKQFEEFAEKYPKHKDAPLALFNAASMYKKAKLYGSASNLYRRFVDRYPKHPDTPGIRLNLAITAYYGFELDEAEEQFTKLYALGKRGSGAYYRCMALYFRSQLLEYDHRYKRAASGFEDYAGQCGAVRESAIPEAFREELPLFPVAETLYHAFEIYQKMNNLKGMRNTFREFEKRYSRNTEFSYYVIQGYYLLSQEYKKRDDREEMMNYYDKIVRYFKSRSEFRNVDNPRVLRAHHYAAMAEFIKLEPRFKRFDKLKLSCSGMGDKAARKALKKKYPGRKGRREMKKMGDSDKQLEYVQFETQICGDSQKDMLEEGRKLAEAYNNIATTYQAAYSVVARYRIGRIFELVGDKLYQIAEGPLPTQLEGYIAFLNEQVEKLEEALDEINMLMFEAEDPALANQLAQQLQVINNAITTLGTQAETAENSYREKRQQDSTALFIEAANSYQKSFEIIKLLAMFPEMTVWRERIKQALARPLIRSHMSADLLLLRRDVRPTTVDIKHMVPMVTDTAGIELQPPEPPQQTAPEAPADKQAQEQQPPDAAKEEQPQEAPVMDFTKPEGAAVEEAETVETAETATPAETVEEAEEAEEVPQGGAQ